jgi:hypothetical protein
VGILELLFPRKGSPGTPNYYLYLRCPECGHAAIRHNDFEGCCSGEEATHIVLRGKFYVEEHIDADCGCIATERMIQEHHRLEAIKVGQADAKRNRFRSRP